MTSALDEAGGNDVVQSHSQVDRRRATSNDAQMRRVYEQDWRCPAGRDASFLFATIFPSAILAVCLEGGFRPRPFRRRRWRWRVGVSQLKGE